MTAKAELKAILQELARLEAAKREVAEILREAYAAQKAQGWNVPALKARVREILMTDAERERLAEFEDVLEIYRGNSAGPLVDLMEREPQHEAA